VKGERCHAEQLREEVAAVLAPIGLRLSPAKTPGDGNFGDGGFEAARACPLSWLEPGQRGRGRGQAVEGTSGECCACLVRDTANTPEPDLSTSMTTAPPPD
jgi:hypothetical protein